MENIPIKIENVPTGKEKAVIKAREEIITAIYMEWRQRNPEEIQYCLTAIEQEQ